MSRHGSSRRGWFGALLASAVLPAVLGFGAQAPALAATSAGVQASSVHAIKHVAPVRQVVAKPAAGKATSASTCSGTRCDKAGTVELSGSSWLGGNGVNVYSNGSSVNNDEGVSCVAVKGAPASSHCSTGYVYAGEKYQCVELINRLYLTRGWITGTWWGNGDQLYANAPSSLSKQANGSITNLKPGDVISLGDNSGDGGHAAVVSGLSGSTVTIVNQNTPAVYSSATLSKGTLTMSGWAGYYVIGVIHAPSSGGASATGHPAVVQYGGEMDVFVRTSNGDLLKNGFNGTSWGGWGDMGGGGNLASNPVAIQYKSEMDVFVRGNNGQIYKDTWNGSGWSGFNSLGGNLVGDPTAVVYNGGELDVYARGANGDLWKNGFNGSTWGGWGDMGGGGNLASSPYAIQYGGEMDVFIRANNGQMDKDTWNGSGWSGLNSLGGSLLGDPTAVAYGSELDVYTPCSNGSVCKDGWNGTSWGGFASMGSVASVSPTAVVYSNGSYREMDVYTLNGNTVWKNGFNGSTWGGWGDTGADGKIGGEPVAIDYTGGGFNEMDVYAIGVNGDVWKNGFNGTSWGGWGDMGR